MPKWAEVPNAAKAVLSSAENSGFWTVFYSLPAVWRKVEGKTNLVVRGWSGDRQFLAVWAEGKADVAYWWTRDHEAWADLPRELVKWTTPRPTPERVSFRDLKRLLQE